MLTKNYGVEKFPKAEKRRVEVIEASRQRYEKLRAALAKLGTEVSVQRVRENDQDQPPGSFVKRAKHVFVFPPQTDTELMQDRSTAGESVVDATPGYELWWQQATYRYREEAVKGRLQLEYDDGGDSVHFLVDDCLDGQSELPAEVMEALNGIPHEDILPPQPKTE